MATLIASDMTIPDAAQLYTQDGKVLAAAEILHKKVGIHRDVEWVEGDTLDGHMGSQRTSLPTVYDKVANEGVPASVGTRARTLETSMTLEGWSRLEQDVANYGGNKSAKKADQDVAFTESFRQSFPNRLIYANGATVPGQIDGLAKRFGAKAGQNVGRNIILSKTGAGSDYTSLWLIGHGPVKCWYPKGSPAGLQRTEFGESPQIVDGKQIVYDLTRWRWSFGWTLDDWRFIVRIANVDISDLAGGSPPDLLKLMSQAEWLIPDLGMCRPAWYMSRTPAMWLDHQYNTRVKDGGGLTYENVDGHPVLAHRKIPIEILDEISEQEGEVI